MSDLNAPLVRAIDAELRDHSAGHEWTLDDLGTMPRFVALCAELGVSAPDLLSRALARVESGDHGERPA